MREITVIETNFSAAQIRKVKSLINDFYFDGGLLTYIVINKNFAKMKKILAGEAK